MLVPSQKLFYAVEAVLYIAYHALSGPISGTEIAAAQNLPTRYLEPMMQKLVRAKILTSIRGPQGGYTLGRERRNITLDDIYSALIGQEETPESATSLGQQVLTQTAQQLSDTWRTHLRGVTLQQLCEQARAAQIIPTHDIPSNFVI